MKAVAAWWRNQVRWWPLALALRLANRLARTWPGRWPRRAPARHRPGLSVLIPERDTPDLLAATLQAAWEALQRVPEPVELWVVVNGAPPSRYAELRQRFPQVRWQFHARALGYNGAIAAGLCALRHEWVYLLNSDMQLDPDALRVLLPHRQPEVFAITSQIHFIDPHRRREETGWADGVLGPTGLTVYERTPLESTLVRSNLYPGGGSSLCRRAVLQRYVRATACYNPFYYEDTEWGVRAWAEGWEVRFCPTSVAHHHHRGTVQRHYDHAEVARVIQRNEALYQLRQGWSDQSAQALLLHIRTLDARSQSELARVRVAWGVLWQRGRMRRARQRGLRPQPIATQSWYPEQPAQRMRPRVLLVTPFAVYPPAHGGARRIASLVQALADHVEWILLSDEHSLYTLASEPWFAAFQAVHTVEGRADQPGEMLSWPQRMARHAHPRLCQELARLLALYQPDVVQLEHMELAGLIDQRGSAARRTPWLITLHDVVQDGSAQDAELHRRLQSFDAVIACAEADAALLRHPHIHVIPNGAEDRRTGARASPCTARLLFMGPFRYAPNQTAIRAFLREVWPAVRAAHPDAVISILGGAEAAALADASWLRLPGVELITRMEDPTPWLQAATLTINPQQGIRGSALKVIESLLAARVCVCTREGARGFADPPLPGLVVVPDVAAMATPLIELLGDHTRRHALERSTGAALDGWTWPQLAERQLALYRQQLADHR